MFNFRSFFRIGIYTMEKNFNIDYNNGTGGVKVILNIEHDMHVRYQIEVTMTPISSGDVVNNGFMSINHSYYINNNLRLNEYLNWDPPNKYFGDSTFLNLFKDDNLTCIGVVEVQCIVNEIIQNDTIKYEISFITPLGDSDYNNITLSLYALFFLYLFSYLIVPLVLSTIFKPVFGIHHDKHSQKKDEKYLKFISEKANEKQKERTNNNTN